MTALETFSGRDVVNTALKVAGLIVVGSVLRFIYRTYQWRMRFRSLKAQGYPIAEPHSLIFGHLQILGSLLEDIPSDAAPLYHALLIQRLWRKLNMFPSKTPIQNLPPIVYLDIWPFNAPLALIYDPDISAQFLQPGPNMQPISPGVTSFMEALTGADDLLSTDGRSKEWKDWRARLSPGFSARNVTSMVPGIVEEVLEFKNILRHKAGPVKDQKDGGWGQVFELEKATTDLTLDVIGRAAMDVRFNEQKSGPSPLHRALLSQISNMHSDRPLQFATQFNVLRYLRIWWNNRKMRQILIPYIKSRIGLASGSSDPATHSGTNQKTVVDLALKTRKGEAKDLANANSPTNQEIDSKFLKQILNQLKLFLFAGHDTTATTICWIFYNLEKHPQALAKLRAEHDSVLGPDPEKAASLLTESPHLLNSLPYTLAVVKETLRLYPLAGSTRLGAPGASFTVTEEDGSVRQYPVDDFMIWNAIRGQHQNPDKWPRPDDFIPERWTVSEGDELYPPKNTWRAFEIGPKNCIGQELAMVELKVVLALVVREFDIEEAWDEWDRVRGNRGPTSTFFGKRAYQVGIGVPHTKDKMPVHVRVRTT